MGTTRPTPPGVTEIFSEYVRRRQLGNPREEAIEHIKPFLEKLGGEAKHQLAALVRSWESREGTKYKPDAPEQAVDQRSRVAADISPPRPGEDLSWLPQNAPQAVPPSAAQRRPDPAGPVHPSIARQPELRAETTELRPCPACLRLNRVSDLYCFACGALLDAPNVETRSLDPIEEDLYESGPSYFGASSTLLLHVQGAEVPITVKIIKQEMTLGRGTPDKAPRPDVDLAAYNAAELGVSRLHARLRFENNTILVSDLDSVNHTFINGQRLHPHETRALRDGDEIRLGRLALRVAFRHQLRTLR